MSRPRSVLRNAEGSCSPDGSRTSTQRIGTGGMPAWYQTAVPVAVSSVRCWALYHWETTTVVQTVFLLARRALSVGRRRPFQRGAAALTLPAFGGRLEQGGIQPQPGDHADMAADRGEQAQRREAAVGDEDEAAIGQPAFGLQDGLPRPVGQRLVPLAMGLAPARGWGKHGQERQRPASGRTRVSAPATISDSQRRPLVLTKCPFEDRTGSR